jgi:hypothetical protein
MARACTDSAIRGLESDVAALESYRDVLEKQAYEWINDALGFDLSQLTDSSDMLIDVVEAMTTSNLGCDEDQVPFVQDYIQDCLNKIRSEVVRKIKNLDRDTAGVAQALLSVAESFLCSSLSDLITLFERYSLNRLLDAINTNMNCITSSEDAYKYVTEIDDMNQRIDQVLDDLPIDSEGNFDFDTLTEDLAPALTDNIRIYKTQTDSILLASRENMQKQLAVAGDFNPESRF